MNATEARISAIIEILTADQETQDRICGIEAPEDTAHEWANTGLTIEEIAAYIDAECFDVDKTVELHTFGISPSEAAQRIGGHSDTIGYRVSSRDMSAPDALHALI